MAQNGTYRGNFLGHKYFFHKPIYVTEKIRPCLKSLVIFGGSCDFFHSVAGSGYQYCGVWRSFYSPPNSRKNSKLCDHIVTTLQMLSTQYPNSPIIMGADRNSMDISPIINCGLKMRQIVDKPTRKNKILDVIITNVPDMY